MQTFLPKREFDAGFMPFEEEAPMSAGTRDSSLQFVAVRSKELHVAPDEDAPQG